MSPTTRRPGDQSQPARPKLGYCLHLPAKLLPVDLGTRIKQARNELGLSQQAFAERVGVSLRTVGTWERNEGRIPDTKIRRVEDVLQVPLRVGSDKVESPRLNEATDAEIWDELVRRRAHLEEQLNELRRQHADTLARIAELETRTGADA